MSIPYGVTLAMYEEDNTPLTIVRFGNKLTGMTGVYAEGHLNCLRIQKTTKEIIGKKEFLEDEPVVLLGFDDKESVDIVIKALEAVKDHFK